jgi:hypothetical protein
VYCVVEQLTAYDDIAPTEAMMVMSTCSFIVNGPGFTETLPDDGQPRVMSTLTLAHPNNFTLGRKAAHALPIGNVNNRAIILTEG